MRKIILLDERTRRMRVYEMKEPTLRGSGPRRRQGDISINKRTEQTEHMHEASPRDGLSFSTSSKQFGAKMGEHANDFGYKPKDLGELKVRDGLLERLDDIIRNKDEHLRVPWRGQDGVCDAYVKDGLVVILNKDHGFVTAFKEVEGGNSKLNKARHALSGL